MLLINVMDCKTIWIWLLKWMPEGRSMNWFMCRAHQRGPEGLPSEILGLEGYTFMIKKISWKNIVWKYFFGGSEKWAWPKTQISLVKLNKGFPPKCWFWAMPTFPNRWKKYFRIIFFYEIFFIIKVYLSTWAWAPQTVPRTSQQNSAT